MPRKGWNSITVRDDVYEYFFKLWKKEAHEYRLKGITSFSGYVTAKLNELREKYESTSKHNPE